MMVVTCWIPRSQSNLLTGPGPLDNYPDSPHSGAKPPAAHVINTGSNQRALVGAERSKPSPQAASECGDTCQGPLSCTSPGKATGSSIQLLAQLLHSPQGEAPRESLRAWTKEEDTQVLEFMSHSLMSQNLSALFLVGAAWKVMLRPP